MSSKAHFGTCAYCGGEAVWKNTLGKYCSKICKERDRAPRQYEKIRQHRAARLQEVNEEKLRRGCENEMCSWEGEFHPTMLDFDHIDPSTKAEGVCRLVNSGASMEVVWAEISKCRVLCANCHREHSYRAQKR